MDLLREHFWKWWCIDRDSVGPLLDTIQQAPQTKAPKTYGFESKLRLHLELYNGYPGEELNGCCIEVKGSKAAKQSKAAQLVRFHVRVLYFSSGVSNRSGKTTRRMGLGRGGVGDFPSGLCCLYSWFHHWNKSTCVQNPASYAGKRRIGARWGEKSWLL